MRYETRLEKLSVEYSKMLGMMEELQKERQLDKDMVAGVQKAMTLIRETHVQDQTRWDEDKARMERQLVEMAETRLLVEKLRKMTSELKEQVCIQEHARVDLVNKFSTDRAAWQMERANLQSKINQLEEQLARGRKDGGTVIPLEAAWAKERANQQRLLAQAHDLALDLQKQLQSRDQEAAKSRRLLAEQLETEKQAWDKERREKDKLLSELEARVKQHGAVQRQVLEMQERAEREAHQARCDRAQLRQQLSRDVKAVDDVMAGLFINDCKSYITPGLAGCNLTTTLSQFARLRELGGLLMSQGTEEQSTSSDEKASSSRATRDFDQTFIQICAAADQLAKHGNQENGVVGRNLTNSELELLRDVTVICHEGDDASSVQDVTTSMAKSRESSQPQHAASPSEIAGDISLPATISPLTTSSQRVQSSSYACGQAALKRCAQQHRKWATSVRPMFRRPDISESYRPVSGFSFLFISKSVFRTPELFGRKGAGRFD
ncbi:hypothetical protein C0Q70_07908 [Pomacea canaliculata]|uniref:Uncharacterized protein n=1 Tax=Pomacea canaliculata TaxID=400727 RepID=A0A2T7PGC5_POMCA|nr:hypothetical protein C0Q70_07908 [Pomacea canaliculata]